jgi:hypothetical protein
VKTSEGRRERKEQAIHALEDDVGVSSKLLDLQQVKAMLSKCHETNSPSVSIEIPSEIHVPIGKYKIGALSDKVRNTRICDGSNIIRGNEHQYDVGRSSGFGCVDITDASNDCSSHSDDSTSVANMLLLLSKTG